MTDEIMTQLSQDLCRKASYLGCMVGDPYWLERSAK